LTEYTGLLVCIGIVTDMLFAEAKSLWPNDVKFRDHNGNRCNAALAARKRGSRMQFRRVLFE
jgi:hypothetical protein